MTKWSSLKLVRKLIPYVCLLSFSAISQASDHVLVSDLVITNASDSATDTRYEYPTELLKRALEVTEAEFGHAQFTHAEEVYTRDRALLKLIEGKDIHVMAEASKIGWSENLIEIKIPLRKGIQGLRLFFVHEGVKPVVENITSIEQLKLLKTGSGIQWSTRKVLEDAGFTVVTSSQYESLFKMLSAQRFDTFARGINEIFDEYQAHSQEYPNISIAQDIGLYQLLPTYFYVSPKRPKLAQRLEKGLRLMIESGEFDELFCQYNATTLNQIEYSQGNYFCLPNTNLKDTSTLDQSLFVFGTCDYGKLDTKKLNVNQICPNPNQ